MRTAAVPSISKVKYCGKCRLPRGSHSPNCTDLSHRPAIPDEVNADTIVEYKKSRLEFIFRYLSAMARRDYGSIQVRWDLIDWFREMCDEAKPSLALSHTYMYTLPVLSQGRRQFTYLEREVSCDVCGAKVPVQEISGHEKIHTSVRRERVWKILLGEIGV